MSRRLYLGLAIALLVFGGAVLWWRIAGSETFRPTRQSIQGVGDSVRVEWTAQHTARIEANNTSDALTALGYVHGVTRSWVVTVWRRTALGTVSSQFGDGLIPLDRHARRLGFAHHARRAYRQLSTQAQNRLRAYTRGLNAALQSDQIYRQGPFVVLDASPKRWKPWHPLAIERLLAWIGTGFATPSTNPGPGPKPFRDADRLLRRWLHLHGWNRSVVWAARSVTDSTDASLFARHVLGASADPLIQEVAIHRPEHPPTVGASLPGTLLFPTGTNGNRAWSYLLSSDAHLDRVELDTTQIRDRHERLTPRSGNEQLVQVRRYDDALLLESVPPDSAWLLRWPGLGPHSDVSRWASEADLALSPRSSGESSPPFHLIHGTGLVLDSAGEWTVQGQPPVVEQTQNMVLVGHSSWSRYQAQSLRVRQTRSSLAPDRWSVSDSSTWAADRLPRLLPSLERLSGTAPLLDDALTYLRNWNYTYGPSSIGAVLFEQWTRSYRAAVGHLPRASEPAYFVGPRSRRAFRRAVSHLAARYGADVRQWRWERVSSTRRRFLVWSADSLVATDLRPLSTTRFAPLERPGRGHISTLAGGPSLVAASPFGSPSAQWAGWMKGGDSELTVRRLRFDPSGFLARSLLGDDRPAPAPVSGGERTTTTQILPARP